MNAWRLLRSQTEKHLLSLNLVAFDPKSGPQQPRQCAVVLGVPSSPVALSDNSAPKQRPACNVLNACRVRKLDSDQHHRPVGMWACPASAGLLALAIRAGSGTSGTTAGLRRCR